MYTVEEFVRRAMASRGLICYGTGKRFQVFVECFQGTQVLDKVAFCVDRDARFLWEPGWLMFCQLKR